MGADYIFKEEDQVESFFLFFGVYEFAEQYSL
jgi:hypothetical protein